MSKISATEILFISHALSNKTLKAFVLLCLLLIQYPNVNAQTAIKIKANNEPLSYILVKIRDNYGIQLSFDHNLLSNCYVTDSSTYSNAEHAIQSLISNCNLQYELSGEIFIISEKEAPPPAEPAAYYYSGKLSDAESRESLPFSSIQLYEKSFITDVNGNFSFKSIHKTTQIRVSHLGYFILDTLLSPGTNQQIKLKPSQIELKEVVVSTRTNIFDVHIGEQPGLIKLNHNIATFLPGNNNNTLFNLLRLQPGILATAEYNSDFNIWGSYRGQNLIKFDGITLFSASSLNNEIGAINPLIVKDVEVYKSGYNVDKGDRIGGVIQLTGNNGSNREFYGNINLNNQTINGILNIPIAEKMSLQAAMRQSFNSVIKWNDISNNSDNNSAFSPNFQFQDLNLKLTSQLENGDDFYINFLGSKEHSFFNIVEERKFRGRALENTSDKHQYGLAANYSKVWRNYGTTQISFAHSTLYSAISDRINANIQGNGNNNFSKTFYKKNTINETEAKLEHQFNATSIHHAKLGVNFIENSAFFKQDSIEINNDQNKNSANRLGFYFIDNISMGSKLLIQPGLKIDYLLSVNESFVQPRVKVAYKPFKQWQINYAWGKYNQFVSEISLVDERNNRYFYWALNDNKRYPVLSAIHNVFGVSFSQPYLKLSVESFYKTTDGLSRFYNRQNNNGQILIEGESRAYGIDFYAEKQIRQHNFWVSYTISKTEEKLSRNQDTEYRDAQHDQRHEAKGAAIIGLNPWYISMNYVYGSGLAYTSNFRDQELQPYHRMDIAFLYKFKTDKFNLEAGLSIVNLLNASNVGYSGYSNLPDGQSIYSQGIPFTPSLFINIGF